MHFSTSVGREFQMPANEIRLISDCICKALHNIQKGIPTPRHYRREDIHEATLGHKRLLWLNMLTIDD